MSYTLNTIGDLPVAGPLSGDELLIFYQNQSLVTSTVSAFKQIAFDELYQHMANHNNPHQVALQQLIDVNLSDKTAGDLIQYNGTDWTNIRKETVVDGGDF